MPKESYVQGKILVALRARGGYWVKYHASQYTPAGVPDILGCYRGLFVALEIKNPGIKKVTSALSAEQKVHAGMILQAEGMVGTFNSVDAVMAFLDQVDAILDG